MFCTSALHDEKMIETQGINVGKMDGQPWDRDVWLLEQRWQAYMIKI